MPYRLFHNQNQMQQLNNNSIIGTIATIILGAYGVLDVDIISKIVFMTASVTTCTFTSIYTYHKIKKLKNESNSEKH